MNKIINETNLKKLIHSQDTKKLQLLLAAGLDPNSTLAGIPLITYACDAGSLAVTKLLLGHNADPNKKINAPGAPYDQYTPLAYMYFSSVHESYETPDGKIYTLTAARQKELAALLYNRGASLIAKNGQGGLGLPALIAQNKSSHPAVARWQDLVQNLGGDRVKNAGRRKPSRRFQG